MGVFELDRNNCAEDVNAADLRRLREECIIALKVYDSCRQQDCLTGDAIGPSRAAVTAVIGNQTITEGEVIDPPNNTASVSVDNLKVKKVIIIDKEPNPFKNGFWDVTLKYVFVYTLTFREADGQIIGSILANSIFTKKVTLFGSVGSDIVLSTDLFKCGSDSFDLDSDPFILVESKAVPLTVELKYTNCCCDESNSSEPNEVFVTIGLFTIIKIFRIVNLTVESRGFCIPEQCEQVSPLNPCDFFENLDFPMDIFAPPQKPEFLAGITNNIPNDNGNNSNNNCNNCNNCGNCSNCGNCGNCNSCGCR